MHPFFHLPVKEMEGRVCCLCSPNAVQEELRFPQMKRMRISCLRRNSCPWTLNQLRDQQRVQVCAVMLHLPSLGRRR